jgi:hypothetical protein
MILSGVVEKKSFKLYLLLLPFLSLHVFGQEFGGNPPSLKWKQINTGAARIIFPSGLESQARDVGAIVQRLTTLTQHSLGNKTRKISIVLQNQTTLSNGYVSLGPFRSEFLMTPRQNSFELGSLPWHKSLALHEYRHAQQYENFRKGVSKAFYIVFGEEGQALANNLAVPDWFFEGDAVYQETKMSPQGRGRIPYFFNGYRSLWAAKKNYSWMKLRNGSYRDYTPDHYQLGYLLVAYGYHKYGDEAWKKITADAVRFKSIFYPFQQAFKKNTGQSFGDFTKETFNYFSTADSIGTTIDAPSGFARSQAHFVADEQYPQWTDDGRIIYLRSSFREIPAFYERDATTGIEKKIADKSISADAYFSGNGRQIVYSRYRPDPRWGWKNFEELVIFDVTSRTEKTITRNTRYQSPDISKDGTQLVAVSANTDGTSAVHVINAQTGKVTAKVPNQHAYVYTYPKFYNIDTIVAAIRDTTGRMALGKISIKTGAATWLTPFSWHVIGFPQVSGDTVFFSMSENNQDRLFAAANGTMLRFHPSIENHFTGNYQLTARNGRYAWTSFTASGYHIYNADGTFEPFEENHNEYDKLHSTVNLVSDTNTLVAKVEPYNKVYRLFNFHSWRPYFTDPEYSYSLISENILNTLQSEIYVTYNRNEKFKQTGASLAYGGWYPIVSGGASYTFDRSFADSAAQITWGEFNARIGASVPLTFVHRTFTQNLNLSTAFNTQQVYYTGASKITHDNKRFNFGDVAFSFTNQRAKARQQIFPSIAQAFSLRYRRIINKYSASQLLMSAALYLPGFVANHSIVLQGSYQRRDTLQQYNFSNGFPFSRGYPDIDFPRMWRAGANYHFPIAYPEWGLANIVYLSRLRGNVYYDFSRVKSLRTGRELNFNTIGTEIYFDTRWWNQLPVSFGIRYSRLLDADILGISPNQWELILPVNLLAR